MKSLQSLCRSLLECIVGPKIKVGEPGHEIFELCAAKASRSKVIVSVTARAFGKNHSVISCYKLLPRAVLTLERAGFPTKNRTFVRTATSGEMGSDPPSISARTSPKPKPLPSPPPKTAKGPAGAGGALQGAKDRGRQRLKPIRKPTPKASLSRYSVSRMFSVSPSFT